ncbi:hypothetical protein D1872_233470 [compost metagenome]
MQSRHVHEGKQAHQENGDQPRDFQRRREGQGEQHEGLNAEHVEQGTDRSAVGRFPPKQIADRDGDAVHQQNHRGRFLGKSGDFMKQRG